MCSIEEVSCNIDPIKEFLNFSPTPSVMDGDTNPIDQHASDTCKGSSCDLDILESTWNSLLIDHLAPNGTAPPQMPYTPPDSNMDCDTPDPNASNNHEYVNIFENPPPPTAECIYVVPEDDNQGTERRETRQF
jgi:hypothetical protein